LLFFNRIENMKKLKSILGFVVLFAFVTSCFLFVFPALEKSVIRQTTKTQPIILTLWHVESFEGGVGNRAEWLKKRALEFEKKYSGVYVDVVKYSPSQLAEKLLENRPFDMLSFGVGIGYDFLTRLRPIQNAPNGVFDNLLRSASVDGKYYALPYSSGGYILATRSQDVAGGVDSSMLKSNPFLYATTKKIGKKNIELNSVLAGCSQYCCPIFALATLAENKQNCSVYFSREVTQYGAYEKFLYGNTATVLLGTQRDYWRISNRQKNGKIGQMVYSTVGNYTDLTQYIGLGQSGEEERERLSERFVEFLLTEKSQKTLSSVGMLSVLSTELYAEDDVMSQLQKELSSVSTLNAFISPEVLQRAEQDALDALQKGKTEQLKKYVT